jgi:hypothetical protein
MPLRLLVTYSEAISARMRQGCVLVVWPPTLTPRL